MFMLPSFSNARPKSGTFFIVVILCDKVSYLFQSILQLSSRVQANVTQKCRKSERD
jgi:hypothetical protein